VSADPEYRSKRTVFAVTGAIVGARSAKQADGVMRAGEIKLSDADRKEIESASMVAA